MIDCTTNSNEFRSKDGTVVRIPDADFNIVPRSVTKNTTPCSTRIRTTTICVNNQVLIGDRAVGSLVVRASDSRPENLSSMPDATKYPPSIFDVKDAPRTGRPVVENVDKITEIIKVDRLVSSRSIVQELKIDYKTVLNDLCKVAFKKKLDVWVPHQLTPKNMMYRISICEALAKRNEIDPLLKRMVTEDEKWVP
ncbi:histone-lysine N-methyltransferase SETMAR [Trichonephila clavipes]|uniref:Histone-lysine N-methyltransferase SETMAR n=1 Tax=Trichonephila clavipes TaxID=2585209 RepID=A0A8X6W5Q5_TRICX|nr:histone-lysine N-methyltransferase SETMAR [Trichonephila clavipes]